MGFIFYYGSVSAWGSQISNSLRTRSYCQQFKNIPHKISDFFNFLLHWHTEHKPQPSWNSLNLIMCYSLWIFMDIHCWSQGSQSPRCSNIPKWQPNLEDLHIKPNVKMSKGLSCNSSKTIQYTLEMRERETFPDTMTRQCGTICSRKIVIFDESEHWKRPTTLGTGM